MAPRRKAWSMSVPADGHTGGEKDVHDWQQGCVPSLWATVYQYVLHRCRPDERANTPGCSLISLFALASQGGYFRLLTLQNAGAQGKQVHDLPGLFLLNKDQ